MSAATGLHPSTIQSWKEAGRIPAKRQQLVLDKARARGIDLQPADFFDAPPDTSASSEQECAA